MLRPEQMWGEGAILRMHAPMLAACNRLAITSGIPCLAVDLNMSCIWVSLITIIGQFTTVYLTNDAYAPYSPFQCATIDDLLQNFRRLC